MLECNENFLSLNEFYREDFQKFTKSLLAPDEMCHLAGSHSYGEYTNHGFLYSQLNGWRLQSIGYFLITYRRLIQINFIPERRSKIKVARLKELNQDRYFFIDINSPLSKKELMTRQVIELNFDNLDNIDRQDYECEFENRNVRFIHICLGKWTHPMIFQMEEGQKVYELILELSKKKSDETMNTIPPNFLELLQKLEELHKYQVISDVDYEAAKKKLLG